jgi:hypothetical protein
MKDGLSHDGFAIGAKRLPNTIRPHEALGGLTPCAYAVAASP